MHFELSALVLHHTHMVFSLQKVTKRRRCARVAGVMVAPCLNSNRMLVSCSHLRFDLDDLSQVSTPSARRPGRHESYGRGPVLHDAAAAAAAAALWYAWLLCRLRSHASVFSGSRRRIWRRPLPICIRWFCHAARLQDAGYRWRCYARWPSRSQCICIQSSAQCGRSCLTPDFLSFWSNCQHPRLQRYNNPAKQGIWICKLFPRAERFVCLCVLERLHVGREEADCRDQGFWRALAQQQ